MLYNIGKNENDRKQMLKDMEHRFLIGMAYSESYKYQTLKVLEIIYEKASETDPQFRKDYEKILYSTEKKFEQFGDEWVKNINEVLGYKTEYKNWKQATKYIERLLADTKKQDGYRDTD
jgi:hypothetical protein